MYTHVQGQYVRQWTDFRTPYIPERLVHGEWLILDVGTFSISIPDQRSPSQRRRFSQ